MALCARAFGAGARLESVRELAGGGFNTVYLIRMTGREAVILRVAPSVARRIPWHEANLMRREHAVQPFLAPIAPLLPQTITVDFTHQIIDRDYLFQTYMPGERWSDVAGDLQPDEEVTLWRQLARTAKTIHGVLGESFGHPYPGRQFPSWSRTVLDWLERVVADAQDAELDVTDLRILADAARANSPLLDEIKRPHLMHGDLWTFNVLLDRRAAEPRIAAVLDYDRAAWGDPLAEWMFHLLPRRATSRMRSAFWAEYGEPEQNRGTRFRRQVYDGIHAGNVLAELRRLHREDLVAKVQASLHVLVAEAGTTRS